MLQKIFIILTVLILAVAIMFFFRGKASQNGQAAGLTNGQLTKCSNKPNCACSEYADDDIHFVEPLSFDSGSADKAWDNTIKAISATGGKIVENNGSYAAATYTSSVFKFVDDVELRLDRDNNLIHIRSASREGYSDLGVNAKRVESIRAAAGL